MGQQVLLAGEVIEEGGLGDLGRLAQVTHRERLEGDPLQPLAQGLDQAQAGAGRLALAQGDLHGKPPSLWSE